MCEKLIR